MTYGTFVKIVSTGSFFDGCMGHLVRKINDRYGQTSYEVQLEFKQKLVTFTEKELEIYE